MGRCIWKPDDEYEDRVVRYLRNGCSLVLGCKNVDCGWEGTDEARVVAGGVSKWYGLAGREDRITNRGGGGNSGDSGERRRIVESVDDKFIYVFDVG